MGWAGAALVSALRLASALELPGLGAGLMKALPGLKDKDNKIKKTLEDILKEYESWKKKSMKYLKKGKAEITDSGEIGRAHV